MVADDGIGLRLEVMVTVDEAMKLKTINRQQGQQRVLLSDTKAP